MYFEYLFKNDDISHLTNSWCTQNFKTKLELKECTYKKSTTYLIQKYIFGNAVATRAKKKSGKETIRKNLASPCQFFSLVSHQPY